MAAGSISLSWMQGGGRPQQTNKIFGSLALVVLFELQRFLGKNDHCVVTKVSRQNGMVYREPLNGQPRLSSDACILGHPAHEVR